MSIEKKFKIGSALAVRFSPDGKRLAVISNRLTVWDVYSKKKLFSIRPMSHISRVIFSPDGKRIALKNSSGQIIVCDAAKDKVLCDFKNHSPNSSDGADPVFSGCGNFIIDGTWDGEILVHNVKTGKVVFKKTLGKDGMIDSINLLQGGKKYLVRHSGEYTKGEGRKPYISTWNWPLEMSQPKPVKGIDANDVSELFCSEHAGFLAIVTNQRELCIYKLEGLEKVFQMKHQGRLYEIRFSYDGKWLAVLGDDTIKFLSTKDFKTTVNLEVEELDDFAFSPAGDCIAVGTRKGVVYPWNEILPNK